MSNATNTDRVVPQLVASRAASHPDILAVVDIGQGQVTWAELDDRVRRWAGLLHGLGVRHGDRVLTQLPPGVDAHAVWVACGWLGVFEVPVGTAYLGALLRHVVSDSGPVVVVTQGRWVARFTDIAPSTPTVRCLVAVGSIPPDPAVTIPIIESEGALNEAGLAPLAAPRPEDLAAVMYTSGTTGPSKGVLVPWAQLATGIDAFDDCAEGDVLFAPFLPSHLAGKLPLQLMAYWAGTHVLREGFKTRAFWDDVRTHRCNRAWLFHALANFLWRQPPQPDDADNPLETVTGGPLLHEFREFETRFGLRMRTNYGMTEVGWPLTTGDSIDDPLSCGRPRPGYDLRIVDDDDVEVPVGAVGELVIRAHDRHEMHRSYFAAPEATAKAWRGGWFHTGDGFRRDHRGNWFFVDRMKDTIRRRSENISSFEVESLVGEHPSVLEVAAVGVASEHGEHEVLVCVVAKPGHEVVPSELIGELEQRMPSFMVPRFVELRADLPKTPTGKVRKADLRNELPSPATWDRLATESAIR